MFDAIFGYGFGILFSTVFSGMPILSMPCSPRVSSYLLMCIPSPRPTAIRALGGCAPCLVSLVPAVPECARQLLPVHDLDPDQVVLRHVLRRVLAEVLRHQRRAEE